jgi:hypothetical protein
MEERNEKHINELFERIEHLENVIICLQTCCKFINSPVELKENENSSLKFRYDMTCERCGKIVTGLHGP